MKDTSTGPGSSPPPNGLLLHVPEEPFGIRHGYWKAGVILFTLVLMAVTVAVLISGGTSLTISSLYVIPAILFPYFYRRRGVLAVYLVSMFYLSVVVLFRYPSADDIFSAAIRVLLLTALALFVSHLTAHLIREKRKYHAIFENTENGVLLVNLPDHTILEQNQRFAIALALTPADTAGRTLEEFIVDGATLAPLFRALDSHCSVPATETVMRRGDGALWVAIIAARKISADHAVLTFIDITERRRIDEQLRQSHADTNLYLDILTHDINNINTASLNYGKILETRTGEERERISRKMIQALERSDEIIRNISTLRILQETSARAVPLHLNEIIRNVVAGFPDHRIDYDGKDAVVMADGMLSSVFNNLIGNSIKYGGTEPHVVIQVEPRDTDVLISIEDNGHGIPDALKPLVFERFQRGDTTVSGKGLGLFICRSLVERYGGQIRAEDRIRNDPSQGTVIRFTLLKGKA
jgi:signal transduction histidine kinase